MEKRREVTKNEEHLAKVPMGDQFNLGPEKKETSAVKKVHLKKRTE